MNVPANLKYSNDHEWCRVEGDTAVIGITDFAQSQLGDIVFVDVPTVGETLAAGEVFGSIEAVKTVSDGNPETTTCEKTILFDCRRMYCCPVCPFGLFRSCGE